MGVRCSDEGRSSDDPGRHQRAPFPGRLASGENRATRAAVCPPALCAAILRGVAAQRIREGLSMPGG
eukprot:6895161-Alexandrium_andersonii.AAC.1